MQIRRPRVLLVGDDPQSLEPMIQALGDWVEAVGVSSSEEALRRLWHERFDLCIAELRMRQRSGMDLALAIREQHPSVGRILVSEFADASALLPATQDGTIFRYIPRPFSSAQLRSAVEQYLRASRAGARSDWVLVADDSLTIRSAIELILGSAGFEVITAEDGNEALAVLRERDVAVAIVDLDMPGMTGLEVVAESSKVAPEVPPLVLSAHVQHHLALDALAAGAFDFVPKPITREELLFRVKRALNERRRQAELLAFKAAQAPAGSPLVAESPAMRDLLAQVRALASSDATILITGETGAGKDALAREIHRLSRRSAGMFFAVNCGALPETLLESELFGHEKGAFTGAVSRRKGFFEMADGGTLFLDELGEMSPATQVKLLRVLEERKFNRVGGTHPVSVDVRVIAATNRNLEEMVAAKTFRADLYYRLNVIPLHLAPLRERPEDIGPLIQVALAKAAPGRRLAISPRVLAEAQQYSWPGNVRELFNCVARAVALCPGEQIETLGLAAKPGVAAAPASAPVTKPLKAFVTETVEAAEQEYLRSLLRQTGGSLSKAAQIAGVDRKSIYNKMKAYGLTKEEFKRGKVVPLPAPTEAPVTEDRAPAAGATERGPAR